MLHALSVGVLFVFCNILDNVKSHIVKTTITILSQTPTWASWRLNALTIEPDNPEHFATHLSLHFLCLALSPCLTKLLNLKFVDSVANAVSVTCKLHPTGFKVNAEWKWIPKSQWIFIADPLEVFQPFSPKTTPSFRLVDQHSPHDLVWLTTWFLEIWKHTRLQDARGRFIFLRYWSLF